MSTAQDLFQTYKSRLIAWATEHSLFIENQTTTLIICKTEEDLHQFVDSPWEIQNTDKLIICSAHELFMAHYMVGPRAATLKSTDDACTYSEHFVDSDGMWKYLPSVSVSKEAFECNFSIMQQFFLSPFS